MGWPRNGEDGNAAVEATVKAEVAALCAALPDLSGALNEGPGVPRRLRRALRNFAQMQPADQMKPRQ